MHLHLAASRSRPDYLSDISVHGMGVHSARLRNVHIISSLSGCTESGVVAQLINGFA